MKIFGEFVKSTAFFKVYIYIYTLYIYYYYYIYYNLYCIYIIYLKYILVLIYGYLTCI